MYSLCTLQFHMHLIYWYLSTEFTLMTWLILPCLQDEIGLKEWSISLRSAHKMSLELLSNMAKKAGRIYGTEGNNKPSLMARNGNGNWENSVKSYVSEVPWHNQQILKVNKLCYGIDKSISSRWKITFE